MSRRIALPAACIFVVTVLVASLLPKDRGTGREERARGGNEELLEQQETTDGRLQALAEARAEGRFGVSTRVVHVATPGWAGETLMKGGTDDWEPAIAADPHDSYVYVLLTRYGEPKPCPGNCPSPFIALYTSNDGGRTFDAGKPLCACKGSGQFDPIIEVVPNTGEVYAAYMNGYNVMFVKSDDHGQTWTEPVKTYGTVSWNDKDVLSVSQGGKHVYVSWNGPKGGDPWVAQSHDRGVTWTQTRLVDSKRYYFAFDTDILPNGSVVFAESSIDYSGPGGSPVGVVKHHVFVSTDKGETWTNVVVDTVEVGEPCVAVGCGPDFYIGHDAISADEDGDLVVLYDGASGYLGPQRIYARTSSDGGFTWNSRVALSVAGENATSPAVEQFGDGSVRAWYMQTANGDDPDAWNVWYRTSADGGTTWSAPVKVSDATSGADYKHPDGFEEVYGDYGEIAVTNAGKTVAAWGEGFSWLGPGGVWLNRET